MEYILNYEPFIPDGLNIEFLLDIENKIRNNFDITFEEATIFLSHLSYLVRYKINPNLNDYTYKCDLAQSMIYYYLEGLGCKVILNATQSAITQNIEGHSFLVVELNISGQKELFLVDPTYIQFFKKEDCSKEKYLIINNLVVIAPKPGYFIKEQDKELATYLLRYGNIVLNEEVAKMYGDSFYNTKVGEHYHSNDNVNTFKSMPGSIYINAFTKNNCSVSKTKEELQLIGLNIDSISELEELNEPKL